MTCGEKRNQQELAIQRLATQFKESSNLINYIKQLLVEADNLETVFQQLLCDRYIDTAIGAQLDVLGIIVGQPRGYLEQNLPFFGFEGAIGAGTFGTNNDAGIGEVFRSFSDIEFGEGRYDDGTYRVLIRAKARKNHTDATIDEVIDIVLDSISSTNQVVLTETYPASFKLTFVGTLTDIEKLFLTETDYVPKPAGVSVSYADDSGDF